MTTASDPADISAFDPFLRTLSGLGATPDRLRAALAAATIGEGMKIETPFGRPPLTYVDYVASGRALEPVERFVMEQVLPVYANTHTEASHCGKLSSRLREAARAVVARHIGAGEGTATVFTGAGATAAVNRLVGLLGVAEAARAGRRVVVLTGPWEHHSNILPWRESGATVHRLPEGGSGDLDLDALDAALDEAAGADMIVGAFSAASNVTGLVADVARITRRLKAAGALAVWDYAAGAPYLDISMQPAPDAPIDALFYSSHKFPGGPGASGILAVRHDAVRTDRPTAPGGGTVSFVSPWGHDYSARIEAREEGGTPNIPGDIRAALVVLAKESLGAEFIAGRNRMLSDLGRARLGALPGVRVLGATAPGQLPIFSFEVANERGVPVHQQLFTRILSDVHGIQARGGCACAGPYGHDLLDIDEAASAALRDEIRCGNEAAKPGWIRMNLSYLASDAKAGQILDRVAETVSRIEAYAGCYTLDPVTARFTFASSEPAARQVTSALRGAE